MQASWKEFHLCPVEVRTCGVLTYGILPTGPEIPMISTDHLPPGDYGWYFASPSPIYSTKLASESFFTEPKKKSPILMAEMQSFKVTQSTHIEDFLNERRLTDPQNIVQCFRFPSNRAYDVQ